MNFSLKIFEEAGLKRYEVSNFARPVRMFLLMFELNHNYYVYDFILRDLKVAITYHTGLAVITLELDQV